MTKKPSASGIKCRRIDKPQNFNLRHYKLPHKFLALHSF